MLTSTVALTGLSIMCVDHRAVRPLLRRQEGTISTRPALAPVVVVAAVVDRRRQEASRQVEEVVEAEVVRLARVPDPVVGGAAAAVQAEEVEVEVEVEAEVELSPVLPAVEAELSPVPLTPELSNAVPPRAAEGASIPRSSRGHSPE
jgi:hypothetical protein